jgi:hypothetical protein
MFLPGQIRIPEEDQYQQHKADHLQLTGIHLVPIRFLQGRVYSVPQVSLQDQEVQSDHQLHHQEEAHTPAAAIAPDTQGVHHQALQALLPAHQDRQEDLLPEAGGNIYDIIY